MSRAPAAARSGQDYQARFFWAKAAAYLLQPRGPVSRVGFDVDDVDGFDDVVIERSRPDRDQYGRSVLREYYQVKFHVDHGGDLTVDTLTDPREIGGTRYSFLERLKRTSQKLGASASEARFWLVSTYPIARGDLLQKLISTTEGAFRMRELRSGGPSSSVGRLRAKWREHLEFDSDEELLELLYPIRIYASAPHYEALRSELEFKLPALGLRAPGGDGALSPYEDLIWNLNREEKYYFDSESLRRECERAGLLDPGAAYAAPRRPLVCVRSFCRPGIDLADTADEILSLLEFFDGRFLGADHSWGDIHGRLSPFLEQVTARHRSFDLQIDTHASLAFATGAELQAKLGLDLSILQFSRSGPQRWSAVLGARVTSADLAVDDVRVDKGSDVALALAISHDIVCEVREHIDQAGLPISRLLAVRPTVGSGQAAVRDGEHALAMADEIARVLKSRTREERAATLHLFAAAPNGLVFFLGQLSPSLGHVTLYEYDFEQTRSGGYEPSFSLPSLSDS